MNKPKLFLLFLCCGAMVWLCLSTFGPLALAWCFGSFCLGGMVYEETDKWTH